MHVYRSNKMELLLEALAETRAEHPEESAHKKIVLAPSRVFFEHYIAWKEHEWIPARDFVHVLLEEILGADVDNEHFAKRVEDAVKELRGNSSLTIKELHLFMPEEVPSLYFELFAHLSKAIDVHCYLLTPTPHYWQDISTRTEAGLSDEHGSELWQGDHHPLLAILGRVTRSFEARLSDFSDFIESEQNIFEEVQDEQNLQCLQRSMFELQPREANRSDTSLSVEACTSAAQEIEALYHSLRNALEANELRPAEIAILAPDIDDYAHHIARIFGHKIPFTILGEPDISAVRFNAIFGSILSQKLDNYDIFNFVELIAHPLLSESFRLEQKQAERLETLARSQGLRRGLERKRTPKHSWRDVLDALLDTPQARLHADDEEIIEKASKLCDALIEHHHGIGTGVAPSALCVLLKRSLGTFIQRSNDTRELLIKAEQAIDTLCQNLERIGFDQKFTPQSIVKEIKSIMLELNRSTSIKQESIICGDLQALKSTPFKLIALLGISANTFPRYAPSPNIEHGIWSLSALDQHAFLNTLLSCRERLIIACSAQESNTAPASVAVEVLRAVHGDKWKESVGSRELGIESRVSSLESRVSSLGSQIQTQTPGSDVHDHVHDHVHVRDENIRTIDLEELTAWLWDPLTQYLRQRLKIAFVEDRDETPLDPTRADALLNWKAGSLLLSMVLEGTYDRAGIENLPGFPAGVFGQACREELFELVDPILRDLRVAKVAGQQEMLPIDLKWGSIHLIDSLKLASPTQHIGLSPSIVGQRSEFRFWLEHLLVSQQRQTQTALFFGRKASNKKLSNIELRALDQPKEKIESMLELYTELRQTLLPLSFDTLRAGIKAGSNVSDIETLIEEAKSDLMQGPRLISMLCRDARLSEAAPKIQELSLRLMENVYRPWLEHRSQS